MIRVYFVILSLCISGFSYGKNDIINDYNNQNFEKVCISGTNADSRNEDILSLIGNACLKIDNINPLGVIIKRLVTSSKYRENASYFATILLQKKLIYQFMVDRISLKNIRLPRTSYILSIVFENIVKKNYKVLDSSKNKIEINVKNQKYILWISNNKPPKVFIDEYKDNTLVKRHWYL